MIDVTTMDNTGKVIFGTTVHLLNMDSDEQVVYKIVGEDEADIKAGKISISSPIARALVGKSEGDVVAIRVPRAPWNTKSRKWNTSDQAQVHKKAGLG